LGTSILEPLGVKPASLRPWGKFLIKRFLRWPKLGKVFIKALLRPPQKLGLLQPFLTFFPKSLPFLNSPLLFHYMRIYLYLLGTYPYMDTLKLLSSSGNPGLRSFKGGRFLEPIFLKGLAFKGVN